MRWKSHVRFGERAGETYQPRCWQRAPVRLHHSPWQRPTNENGNGLIRRYVGKSTNLAGYTPDDLRAIEHRINTMPRRSLHWSSAADVYDAAVAMTG
jgi:IS30 family transposase